MSNPIEYTTFFSAIGKIDAGNICQVWKAQVKTDSGKVIDAFIKHLPPRELFIECIAAQIGRALGISIPRPLLVRIFPAHLPELELTESTLLFGSQDARYPSLQQFTNTEKAIEELRKWPDLTKAGCFDEWIANCDRHRGNILYSGNGSFSLIDHSHAIPRNHPISTCNRKNSLLDIAKSSTDENGLKAISRSSKRHISKFIAEMQQDWDNITSASAYIDESKAAEVKEFLNNRLPHLSALIDIHLNSNQGDLYAATA